ncbi:MAG: 50S ribosomal protein L10 [Candidatus Omnitrophota bacterium]
MAQKSLDKTKLGVVYRQAIVKKLLDNYKTRNSLIAVNFNKVNSPDLTQLRHSLGDVDSKILITKLSLFSRFFTDINKKKFFDAGSRMGALIFVGKDIVATTKVLADFIQEHEDFKLLGGFFDEKELSETDLKQIAKLPSRQELIAKTILSIKSPLIKFRSVLEGLSRKLLLCLISAKDKKENSHNQRSNS